MTNSFYTEFDAGRLSGRRDAEDFRTPFQIDRDRILHTPAFRRLQSKTQVFWSGEYDFYRTRLTHSLEVAQIGRSICHWLRSTPDGPLDEDFFIDSDLVEAVCLTHDLGHPPFGHAGERTLNHLMREHGGFEGNAQTLRMIAERIFSARHTGMDPTRAFLDGILKYKTLWGDRLAADGQPPENHFLYDEQKSYLGFVFDGREFPADLAPGNPRNAFRSIECQVMDWADDTAYSLNDLADGVRAGFLTGDRVVEWAERSNEPHGEGTPIGDLVRAIRRHRIDPFTGKRIGAYIRAARIAEDTNFFSDATNRYRFRLEIAPDTAAESATFKRLSFEIVFLAPQLKQLEHKGSHILRKLWLLLERRYVRGAKIDGQAFQLLPDDTAAEIETAPTEAAKARIVCDFLAGMTDAYAVRMFRRLFTPGFGSIGDLVG